MSARMTHIILHGAGRLLLENGLRETARSGPAERSRLEPRRAVGLDSFAFRRFAGVDLERGRSIGGVVSPHDGLGRGREFVDFGGLGRGSGGREKDERAHDAHYSTRRGSNAPS